MNKIWYKSSLSAAQATLVDLMQRLFFGKIENLKGFWRPTGIGPRATRNPNNQAGLQKPQQTSPVSRDFELKSEVVDLLETIMRSEDASELSVEIRHGLPTSIDVLLTNPLAWRSE